MTGIGASPDSASRLVMTGKALFVVCAFEQGNRNSGIDRKRGFVAYSARRIPYGLNRGLMTVAAGTGMRNRLAVMMAVRAVAHYFYVYFVGECYRFVQVDELVHNDDFRRRRALFRARLGGQVRDGENKKKRPQRQHCENEFFTHNFDSFYIV